MTVSKTFKTTGTYEFRVGVRDSHGNELIRFFTVIVYDSLVDENPRIFIKQRDPYSFVMFASDPVYGIGVRFRNFFWDFGDGNYLADGSGSYVMHTYSNDNRVYPVTLTIVDIFGNRKSVSKFLDVTGSKDDVKIAVC